MDIYSLDLEGGDRWSIINVNVTSPWLMNFIQVAGIKRGSKEEKKRVILVQSEHLEGALCNILEKLNRSIQKPLPFSEWKEYLSSAFRFWQNTATDDYILEIVLKNEEPRLILQTLSCLWHSVYFSMMNNKRRGLPLHTGCVERDGKAFLLMGESGIGKSTACRRIASPWSALCDDETFVFLNDNGEYQAHPFPGLVDFAVRKVPRTYDVCRGLPLASIFFLKQDSVDAVKKVMGAEAAARINNSTEDVFRRYAAYIDNMRSHRIVQFNNAVLISKKTPCFELSLTKEGAFWLQMEKVL